MGLRQQVVLIAGDTCPRAAFESAFISGHVEPVVGDLIADLRSADLTILNLEAPLTEARRRIRKQGPHLKASPKTAYGLRTLGIDAVSLANNHIADYGQAGMQETIRSLKAEGIRWFGCGRTLDEAGELAVFENNGVRIGLLGMAEAEFSIADLKNWGANPIDLMRYVRLMSRVKSGALKVDHLIVLLHAGSLFHPYPSPWLQSLSRFLIEQGATAVLCQHSHVPGVYEQYKGGLIVYGQGDFIFVGKNRPQEHKGYLVKLVLDEQSLCTWELVPYVQIDATIRRMANEARVAFLHNLDQKSVVLRSPQALDMAWREFALSRQSMYLARLKGESRAFRRLLVALNLEGWWDRRYDALHALNYVRCESHREAVLTILEDLSRRQR